MGDGGAKRTAQIEELLKSRSVVFDVEVFAPQKAKSLSERIALLAAGLKFVLRKFSLQQIHSLRNLIQLSKYFGLRIPALNKYVDEEVVFINEDTTSPAFGIPYLVRDIHKSLISVPHNLESLCGRGKDFQSGKENHEWLPEDIERLKMSRYVFCISREETWLLQTCQLNAFYLPYYPPKMAEDYLKSIRAKREDRDMNSVKKFLILGTANNPPTRKGMEEVLNYFCSFNQLPFELHVAGYNTERIKDPHHPQVFHHGTVSPVFLDNLMISMDALIVNQPATSGALTRIIENLVAGLPVFASFGAARSYFDCSDVYVFRSLEELGIRLEHFVPHNAKMPERDVEAENRFINVVKGLLQDN